MVSSVVKPKFEWLVNTPMGPRSELAPGDGVISGIVSWGYMRSNRVCLFNNNVWVIQLQALCRLMLPYAAL